jgi:hypothetical protein
MAEEVLPSRPRFRLAIKNGIARGQGLTKITPLSKMRFSYNPIAWVNLGTTRWPFVGDFQVVDTPPLALRLISPSVGVCRGSGRG